MQALSAGWNSDLFGGNSTLLLQELDTTDLLQQDGGQARDADRDGLRLLRDGLLRRLQHAERVHVQSGGRHDWDNAQYDNLLAQGAAAFNTAKRQEIYTEAQILQTPQAPAVFIFHGLDGYLTWPYIQGPALAKNYLGYDGLQWPQFLPFSTNQEGIYIGNDSGSYPRANESGLL